LDFASNACRETHFVAYQKLRDRFRIVDGQLPQGPRQCLDDHIVAIGDEERAHCERPFPIAHTTLGSDIQWDRRNQRRAPPPSVGGPRPTMDGAF
jgi:hypothetical protein